MKKVLTILFLTFISFNLFGQPKLNLVKKKIKTFLSENDYNQSKGLGFNGTLSVADVKEDDSFLLVAGSYKKVIDVGIFGTSLKTIDCRFQIKMKQILDDLEITCCKIKYKRYSTSESKCYYVRDNCSEVMCPPEFDKANVVQENVFLKWLEKQN